MRIAIIITLIVIAFLVFVASRPSQYRIARSTTISAPAAAIFPHINDLHKSAVWSPWLKIDPNVKVTYEGPMAGVGASSTWAGNSQIGEGRQTIIESKPDELVSIKLEFIKPMPGVATTDFSLKPDGARTQVTWSMHGDNNFVGKIFCVFMNQEKMIGTPFEKGLADLKALVETTAK